MRRFSYSLLATLGLLASSAFVASTHAGDWHAAMHYGGHQRCTNVHGRCNNKCRDCEEKRLNHFWHDYYDSLSRYYHNVSRIDWVAYYKNHACPNYQNVGCCGQGIITYNPVVVTPTMQYLQPNYDPYSGMFPCCP